MSCNCELCNGGIWGDIVKICVRGLLKATGVGILLAGAILIIQEFLTPLDI